MIRRTERFTFFFRPEAPFSQWHPARFELGGKVFTCAEQYMMYGKAILFGDAEIAAAILETTAPKQHKALGRKVRNFSEAIWKANREATVIDGTGPGRWRRASGPWRAGRRNPSIMAGDSLRRICTPDGKAIDAPRKEPAELHMTG